MLFFIVHSFYVKWLVNVQCYSIVHKKLCDIVGNSSAILA